MDHKSIITQITPDDNLPSPPIDKKVQSHSTLLTKFLCCFGIRKSEQSKEILGTNLVTSVKDKYHIEKLLPSPHPQDVERICLVIDLDETLVHSSFKPIPNADFVIPVELDGVVHQVYVLKRPYVDDFLFNVGGIYECVLFTASLAKYADPVTDLLDKDKVFRSRLFRESCVFYKGNYVKDLGRLGRDIKRVVILDNSPSSYIFHPENAVPISTWFDDPKDTELRDLIPFFQTLSKVKNVYTVLRSTNPFSNLDNSWEQLTGPFLQPNSISRQRP